MRAAASRTQVPPSVVPPARQRFAAPVAAEERQAEAIADRALRGAAGFAPLTARAGRGGRPLDAGSRSFFEPRLGLGLRGVRIHDDARAMASAREAGARAYAIGGDIVFGERPGADPALMAHELAHVRQDAEGLPPRLRRSPCPSCHRPQGTQDTTLEALDDSLLHDLPDDEAAEFFLFLRKGYSWASFEGCSRRDAQAVRLHDYDGTAQVVGYVLSFTNPQGSNFPQPTVLVDVHGQQLNVSWADRQAIESVMSPIDFIGPGLLTKPVIAGSRAVGRTAMQWGRAGGEALRSGGRKMVLSARLAGAGAYRALPGELSQAAPSALVVGGRQAAPLAAGPGTVAPAIPTVASGPSFAQLSSELGLEAAGTVSYRSTAAAALGARQGGLVNASRPGVQTHATARSVRGVLGMTGRMMESAHLLPQAVYRALRAQGMQVSAGRALTALLPRAAHQALDQGWVSTWNAATAAGRRITAGDVHGWVSRAIDAVDDRLINAATKGALKTRLDAEIFSGLGLSPGTVVVPGLP